VKQASEDVAEQLSMRSPGVEPVSQEEPSLAAANDEWGTAGFGTKKDKKNKKKGKGKKAAADEVATSKSTASEKAENEVPEPEQAANDDEASVEPTEEAFLPSSLS